MAHSVNTITLLAMSRATIAESRRLLATMRVNLDHRQAALLANSRATIAESRRLLATVEHSASGIHRYKARHREATMVPVRQIVLDVAEHGAEPCLDSAALSVRVYQEGALFNWTVCDPDRHLLGRGTADTELKARTDAFRAGMTYLCWLKDQPAPKDARVH